MDQRKNRRLIIILLFYYSNQICHDIERPRLPLATLNENLILASFIGDYKAAKKAISNGANVNYKNNYQISPMDNAIRYNKIDVVKLLIDNGANLDSKNAQGKSALIDAAGRGNLHIVKLLIEKGTSFDSTFYDTNTKNHLNAVQVAEAEGHTDIVEFLKKYKADRKKEISQLTPLIPDLAGIVVDYEFRTKQ